MISTTEDVPHSAAATLVGGSPDSESRMMLTLTSSSSSSLNDEDLFEPVSLCDIDCTVHDQVPTEASMPSCFDSVAEIDAVGAISNGMLGEHHFYNRPFDSFSSLHSLTSFDSNSYASSSVESPPRPRERQLTMPDIPPELAHLVDSVIMGRLNCMEDLKARISGVNSLEVSRFVVDALLATIVGVEGLGEMDGGGFEELTPTVMLTSRAALVAAELIPLLHWEDDEHFMSPRTRMAKGLLLILSSCTRNRVMCSAIGLLRSLLDSTEKILFDSAGCVRWNAWPLFYCLQVLGGHSLSVMDLERWVFLIKKSIVTEWALPLMLSLENAIGSDEAKGPAITFEFDGESSGLLTQGENRWPFSNGYAFATWIYLELVEELSVDTYSSTTASMASGDFGKSSPLPAARVHAPSEISAQDPHQTPRRIFSFVSADNQWVEAYFFGQFLVAQAGAGKGKKSFMRFSYEFKPQCWYFIGIEHSYKQSLLGKTESELRLYVDGNLQETRPFELIRTSKPLSFCTIGTNPPPALPGLQRRKRQCPLFAEMGPVYIFKESIGPDIMARLASRGGDALPSFGKGAGLPCIAKNEHARRLAEASSALDAVVEESLYFLYHPRLLGRHFCPDASPSAVAGVQQKRAEVLGQVHVATRVHPAESLWALAYGGPMALLPLLVSDVQTDTLEPKLGDVSIDLATHSLSAPIFRIISMVIRHPGNNEELCRTSAPELLSKILNYTLQARSNPDVGKHILLCDEDIVAAVTSICQCLKHNHPLKVKLFGALLLDLKVWGTCSYVLQKKLLSSLADMVFTESSALRDANAVQVLLDGCRRCFWVIRKNDCIDTFSLHSELRPFGEVNALADELLVVIELLMGVAPTSTANEDMQCLLSFLVDCSQPNQVARLLHLIYRLIVQPNASRAQIFAHSFISCGGVETLLVLLQREAASGNCNGMDYSCSNDSSNAGFEIGTGKAKSEAKEPEFLESKEIISAEPDAYSQSIINCTSTPDTSFYTNGERWSSTSRPRIVKSFGDIRFSTNEESSRSNAFNIDNGDGIVVAIINLFGALISSRHLKFDSNISLSCEANSIPTNGLFDEGNTMFDDKVSLLLFALQRTLQAAPQRLMTTNVHMAFLAASANISSDNGLSIYDCGHHLEHAQLLVVLLRALPHASREFQLQTVQGLFFLACSHPENRSTLTCMAEWPEWILEVFISNYAMASTEESDNVSVREIEDLIYNFLIITLEHSMRKKDGWKDVEATIHCAEWLSMAGGCSTGELRRRREEALPIFRRRLLGGLLDFAAWELAAQTQIIAAAAAVAAKASPHEAKAEAEHATHLTVALAENAIVILMLVEDHLRIQGQQSYPADCAQSSTSISSAKLIKSGSLDSSRNETINTAGVRRTSLSTQAGMVSFDALASEADENGQVSAAVLERLTAAAAAEPFESVRCAFVSYGSCVLDLAESWKQRSRMWYGVDLPTNTTFGGGARDWESWQSAIEKDSSGKWIELPLVKKFVLMLQALLLDESDLGSGLSIGGGSVASISGMTALCHLLDSDQPFLCMLRMILLSMREEDTEGDVFVRPTNVNDSLSVGISQAAYVKSLDHSDMLSIRKPRSALLWSALGPLLIMPVSESKRQRVLVACCVLYSEVWNAIGRDRKPIRKQYVEAIVPPFVSVLKRWRPILAGIHELASPEVGNPLNADDFVLSADALPIEAALAMISPSWSAAFASPPAALALAMIAAGASGGNTTPPSKNTHYRCETSLFERKPTRLHTFSSFQKPPEKSIKFPTMPKDKAAAKAAALAAARDLERNAKIGSGRGLSAVAMATSAQRRSSSDLERSRRWNILETMGAAWTECAQTFGSRSVSGREFSALCYKYIAVLVTSFALARNMQRVEMERLVQVDLLERHRLCTGIHAWRKLLCRLLEMNQLFGHFGDHLGNAKLAYWMLDTTENSYRMRRFLKRCYKTPYFQRAVLLRDVHMEESYDQRVSVTDDPFVKTTVVIPDGIPTEDENEYAEKPVSIIVDNNVDNHNMFSNDDPTLHGAIVFSNSWDSDDQILIRPTSGFIHGFVSGETDERIIVELPSLMVRPMMVVSGIFQITTSRINFIADEHTTDEFIAESLAASVQTKEQGKNKSWSITSLSQVFCRRYLVRRTALEFFMADRSNYFFDFGSIEGRRNASRGIIQARPPHLHNLYLTANRPEKFLIKAQLMERWASWEISNFDYLMELNTLSGRSYNDITQYPIFPWIIADYYSKTLNLENPSVYRDLSKPVGALNPDRLKKFRERYSSFDDPIMPKYHYGSHYSNIKTVLYFLIRIEPYATLSAKLLGESNRSNQIFSNICHSWNNVFEDMQDVKELVPEMFYLPEILTNENNIDIRSNKIGESKDPVKLPPWADNPVDFIHKHRRALESEHVSSHLHEWIDLIFGYKQRGEEAASADNAFFYTSYEGAVDLDRILDPVHRCDVRKKIAYFGQTPSLLFTVPHIQRKPLAEILKLQVIFRNPSELQGRPIPQPEQCKLPAASIRASPDSIVIVDLLAPAAHVAQHKWCPYAPDGPLLLQHRRTAGTLSRIFKTPAESLSDDRRQCSRVLAFPAPGIRSPAAIVAITCDYQVITGGHADNSIKLISTDEAKTMETASGHCAPVTCLSLSPDSVYLATGSRDTTVLLWRIHRRTSPSDRRIEGPISVSRGHRDEVVCCSVNSSVGVIASSSASAGVLLHSLRRGRFLRKLDAPPANSVRVSSRGVILTLNAAEKSLRTFTVNGIPIAIATLSPSVRRISCMEISADGGSAIIAASSCESEDENAVVVPSLCFLDLHSLEVVHSVALGEGQDITSFAPSEDGFSLLVSTADKQLIMFSNPAVSICR